MINANYIFSKLMERDSWLNDTDPQPEKRISPFGHTHRGVIALSYELPVGKGQTFNVQSRWANLLLSGWHLNAIYTRQTGQPFTWMGTSSTTIGDLVYFGDKLLFDARETNKVAFNTSAFDTKTADQFAYHIRTFSTTFSSLRGDGTNELNASTLKNFNVREKMYFQFRVECFNAMNRPTFAFPNLSPTNSAFGLITAQSNRSRSIQLRRKLALWCFIAGLACGAPVKVVLVGDSTVNDEGGWGPGFRAALGPGVQVINLARNGRSSKSFRDEGLWELALAAKPGYIILQFGHNDVPGKGPERETDAKTTYRQNLLRYIEEARGIGAIPILVTSIVRRNFNEDGKIKADSLVSYVDEVRAIAAEQNVGLIDLYSLTLAQAEQAGPAGAIEIGKKLPNGQLDTTHLGPKGQQAIGQIAAREFKRLQGQAEVHFIVAADGSGDAKTIQYAIDHAPMTTGSQRLVIDIRPGIYHERVFVPRWRANVTFQGKDAASTVVAAEMSAKLAGGTFLSSTVEVEADGFEAENMTFQNSFGVGSQAVAISVHSDRAVFRKCRFLGWQDTLYAAYGRQYYKDCYIAGHVDFIFGDAAAVFDDCEIHSLGAGFLTAQSRTQADGATGYVFERCRLTGENTGKGVYLGRPWRPYSRVVYLECAIGEHILPEGWNNWGDAKNEETAWYGETGSTGPGARVQKRVRWARTLTTQQAAQFRPENFLRGNDGWNPSLTSTVETH